MKKPEAVPKSIVCSVCDLPWEKHGDKPTLEKCVELLKSELASRPRAQMWLNQQTATTFPGQYGGTGKAV